LYQGRDLAVTTDFREVIAAILEPQFGLSRTQLDKVTEGTETEPGDKRVDAGLENFGRAVA